MIVVSAFSYGTTAIFAKIAYAQGATMISMLAARFTIACLVIWLLILVTRQPAGISLPDLKQMALLSTLGYGIGSTFYFLAVKMLPASLASMLLYMYPVLVVVAELLLYRRQVTRVKGVALFLSTAGLVLILGATVRGMNAAGIVFGLGAAVAYSAYLLYGDKVAKEKPPLLTTGYMLAFAAAGFTLYALISGTLVFNLSPTGWWSIAGLAVISTAMAILTLFIGLQWLEASHAAIISTFEPVFTVVCAAMLFSEVIHPLQVLGGLLVLGAILLLQVKQTKHSKQDLLD